MPATFTPGELAYLATKGTVPYATLVMMQFKTKPTIRLHNGVGLFPAAGEVWKGFGSLGQISGLGDQRGTTSNPVRLTLSGVDPEILPLAIADTEEVDQQRISIFMQLMDNNHQAFGRLIPLFFGLMQPPSVDSGEIGDDGATRTVTLTAENYMIGKGKAPNGRYTDRDQKKRFPGDRMMERISEVKNITLLWPDF